MLSEEMIVVARLIQEDRCIEAARRQFLAAFGDDMARPRLIVATGRLLVHAGERLAGVPHAPVQSLQQARNHR